MSFGQTTFGLAVGIAYKTVCKYEIANTIATTRHDMTVL